MLVDGLTIPHRAKDVWVGEGEMRCRTGGVLVGASMLPGVGLGAARPGWNTTWTRETEQKVFSYFRFCEQESWFTGCRERGDASV